MLQAGIRGGLSALLVAFVLGLFLRVFFPELMDVYPPGENLWWLGLVVWGGALSMGLLVSARVWRELEPNTCTKCGYNLIGNVTGFCPECGCATLPEKRKLQ
jgi:hypothetical protein